MSTIRFPAEWEPQSAILIAWPHYHGDFGDNLRAVEANYRIIAETISDNQALIVLCIDQKHQQHIQNFFDPDLHIQYLTCPYNDIWVRDTAPITIEENGQYYCLNFQFNGWGNKYSFQDDNDINNRLSAAKIFQNVPFKTINLVLEGGSIETDGQGTLLTTRQCLLNENRNLGLSELQISQHLQQIFGASRILWLDQNPLGGDDTDGHIDTLARFCPGNIIAYTACDSPSDTHYSSLKNMEAQLKTFVNSEGQPYNLIPLPLPEPIYNNSGHRLPANYANFLIINNKVLLPVYGNMKDDYAYQQLVTCFADRTVIKIPCDAVIQQYGSLHCLTMQFPENVAIKPLRKP